MAATATSGVIVYGSRRLLWRLEKVFLPPTLVFVSTGGTCRDPMAKVIMQRIAESKRVKIRVHAAGVSQGYSKTAAKAARIVTKEQLGRDALRDHRTKRLSARLATQADLILTMEGHHTSDVTKLFPYAAGKTHTLSAFFGTKRGIPNPYRQAEEVDPEALQRYRSTFRQLEKALATHADKIFDDLGVRSAAPPEGGLHCV